MIQLATTTTSSGNDWMYLALALIMAIAGFTIPALGTPFVASAAVAASQGTLNIYGVIAAAIIGAYIGGLIGYYIGKHWGEDLVARPGKGHDKRVSGLENSKVIYEKWGPLAVFFIPAIFAGIAEMRLVLFCFFYLCAVVFYQLSAAIPAYGLGNAATGSANTTSIAHILIGVVLIFIGFRLYKRFREHRESVTAADIAAFEADD